MRAAASVCALAIALVPAGAETNQERGKRIVDQAIEALGGNNFLRMQDRVERGRAYSFYREKLSGLSIATIYTRYLIRPEPPQSDFLGVREREAFGKKEESAVLFTEGQGYDVTFRLADDLLERFKESTLRNVFYILRQRLGEPELILDSRGSDVVENQPVDIVDIVDADNRTITVSFSQITHLPAKQVTYRHAKTKERIEEVTRFSEYHAVDGVMWPYSILRERDGEKIFQMFSDSVTINKGLTDNLFTLPAGMKILGKPK
jgi:hypothetical protein